MARLSKQTLSLAAEATTPREVLRDSFLEDGFANLQLHIVCRSQPSRSSEVLLLAFLSLQRAQALARQCNTLLRRANLFYRGAKISIECLPDPDPHATTSQQIQPSPLVSGAMAAEWPAQGTALPGTLYSGSAGPEIVVFSGTTAIGFGSGGSAGQPVPAWPEDWPEALLEALLDIDQTLKNTSLAFTCYDVRSVSCLLEEV